MTPDDQAAARKAEAAATPGPWWTGMHDAFSYTTEGPHADSHPVAQRLVKPDAEFIALARTALPAALDALDRVRALHIEAKPGMKMDAIIGFCFECRGHWPCATIRALDETGA